ncbi:MULTISPECIES: hypothetical protein [unclassified Rickettsia]|uniref:hypothetical protein n=1 Tax=unclassified Rickettsia TaxID=114295 RepID=UPI003132E543
MTQPFFNVRTIVDLTTASSFFRSFLSPRGQASFVAWLPESSLRATGGVVAWF